MTDDRRITFIAGLRALADWLEQRTDIPVPNSQQFDVFVPDKVVLGQIARVGRWTKRFSGEWFALEQQFSGDITFHINIVREQICRRVVVGQDTIPAQAERIVDRTEWICDDPVLVGEESTRV